MDSGGTTLVSNDIPLDHPKEETKLEDLEQRDQNVFVLDDRVKTQIILNKEDAKINQNQGIFY